MGVLKKLLNNLMKIDYYTNFRIIEMDDGDALIIFGDDNTTYSLDLEWDRGVMDIQFGVVGSHIYDTTNRHKQYKILNTISRVTQKIANRVEKETGDKFHTVVFKSSDYRNGKVDARSAEIRNRFFSRYVTRLYPNSEISHDQIDNTIIVKLNQV